MITKEDLNDWLKESERKESEKEIEEFIDKTIKRNVLRGKYTFYISTGMPNNALNRAVKTKFHDIWLNPKLSLENQNIVQKRIIQKYRDFGFQVGVKNEDCGWDMIYPALLFIDVDKAVENR